LDKIHFSLAEESSCGSLVFYTSLPNCALAIRFSSEHSVIAQNLGLVWTAAFNQADLVMSRTSGFRRIGRPQLHPILASLRNHRHKADPHPPFWMATM